MTGHRPLRVLHVIPTVSRTYGGPVEGLSQSIRYRSEHLGQYIEVVTLDAPDAACLAEFPGKVHGIGPAKNRYGYSPNLVRWIVENSGRFDVAVIHGLWNYASVGGWRGLRRAGIPYVLFTHGMMDPWFRRSYPLKHLVKQLFWILQGRALRDASEVLFTSEEECRLADGQFFGYRYSSRVVSYAAADCQIFGDDEATLRAGIAPTLGGNPYLLYLSRIHEKKGCDLLLEGFAAIASDRPELHLVIAGPEHGNLGEQLRNRARDLGLEKRIHWPGMVKGSAKAALLREAEAFVLISHQENFGIAVAEALAYGKAVLISDQINIWREIKAGGGGLVVPDTAEGARHLLQEWNKLSPDQRQSMGKAARAVYDDNFTIKSAAQDLTLALEFACEK